MLLAVARAGGRQDKGFRCIQQRQADRGDASRQRNAGRCVASAPRTCQTSNEDERESYRLIADTKKEPAQAKQECQRDRPSVHSAHGALEGGEGKAEGGQGAARLFEDPLLAYLTSRSAAGGHDEAGEPLVLQQERAPCSAHPDALL